MNFFEIKLYLGFLISITWAEFFSADFLIKIIPATVLTAFTLYKWYILYQKRKKNKNIIE